MSRIFIVCDDLGHAEICDQLIMEILRDRNGAIGGGWSGVFSNDVDFGILYSPEIEEIIGPLGLTDLIEEIISTGGDSDWYIIDPT